MMQLQVDVFDVNRDPVLQAHCGLVYVDEKTLSQLIAHFTSGQTVTINNSPQVKRVLLQIQKDDYTPESAVLSLNSGGTWQSSNPAIQVEVGGTTLRIRASLGCIRYAPTKFYPQGTKVGVCENANGVLLEPDNTGYKYRGVWLNDEFLYRMTDPVFGNPNAKEWDRINHEKHLIPLARHGQFVFLEYGFPVPNGQGRPRLLLAAWAPLKQMTTPVNVVVFYSPTTAGGYPVDSYPYSQAYPYRLRLLDKFESVPCNKTATIEDVIQPYSGLATSYVITGYKIIYQLIAGGRNPILIMPIQPSGSWGPLAGKAGLGRMVREVVRFLFVQGLVSTQPRVIATLRFSPERTTIFPPDGIPLGNTVPTDAQICLSVSGFSAGITPIFSLIAGLSTLQKDTLQKQFPGKLFSSPERAIDEMWRELWDVDGAINQVFPWKSGTKMLLDWKKEGPTSRKIRSYHSQDTYGKETENGIVDPKLVKRVSGKAGFVEEGSAKDGTITWVLFSNSYIIGDLKDPDHQKTIPEFGTMDAHHFVPTLAFGHAAQFPI